jgi:serine/threonine-protein kinase
MTGADHADDQRPRTWTAGTLIGDAFRLERQLGDGSSSCVWEAEHLRLDCRVAIKFLAPQLAHDETLRARFLREAKAISKIRSPHVVQVIDHGVMHDLPYLVMELVEGEDLGRFLARQRVLGLVEAASILEQLCRGLDKAHRAGLVHRDIKPENVLLIHENDGGYFVKLLDFGIVKQLEEQSIELTQAGLVLGTPHYLSPEQISNPDAVDTRADIWAVGVLAYRILVGELPFDIQDHQSITVLCEAILAGHYRAPCAVRPELAPELDGWFLRMLAVDPEQRFESIRAASAALSSLVRARTSGIVATDAPVLARRSDRARGGAGARPGSDKWWWLSLTGALLLSAAAFSWRGRPPQPRITRQVKLAAPAPSAAATANPASAPPASPHEQGPLVPAELPEARPIDMPAQPLAPTAAQPDERDSAFPEPRAPSPATSLPPRAASPTPVTDVTRGPSTKPGRAAQARNGASLAAGTPGSAQTRQSAAPAAPPVAAHGELAPPPAATPPPYKDRGF